MKPHNPINRPRGWRKARAGYRALVRNDPHKLKSLLLRGRLDEMSRGDPDPVKQMKQTAIAAQDHIYCWRRDGVQCHNQAKSLLRHGTTVFPSCDQHAVQMDILLRNGV